MRNWKTIPFTNKRDFHKNKLIAHFGHNRNLAPWEETRQLEKAVYTKDINKKSLVPFRCPTSISKYAHAKRHRLQHISKKLLIGPFAMKMGPFLSIMWTLWGWVTKMDCAYSLEPCCWWTVVECCCLWSLTACGSGIWTEAKKNKSKEEEGKS